MQFNHEMTYSRANLRSFGVAVSLVIVALAWAPNAHSAILIDFDALTAMSHFAGTPVPASAQLSDQFVATLGVRFGSGAGYIAVVDLGVDAPSAKNGIGGVTPAGILTYDQKNPIDASFFDPSSPTTPAVTDFVSVRGDLDATSHQSPSLFAFDLQGNLLQTVTLPDVSGQVWSISTPGIHSVRFSGIVGDNDGVAIDDFTFNPVTPIPEPTTGLMLSLGAAVIGITCQQRWHHRNSA